jgi:hypothetical protein
MDSEEFILYVNSLINEIKKELFQSKRLEDLDDSNSWFIT